jgi:hypothetical protein
MNQRTSNLRPLARERNLLVRELPTEVLVYDVESDEGHCLNETAAFVWQRLRWPSYSAGHHGIAG